MLSSVPSKTGSPAHYLLLGEDSRARDLKIGELKKALLPNTDQKNFDCDILYAQGLDAETLKKSLVALPVLARERVVIIRQAHKLTEANKELLKNFLTKPYSPTVLILDSDQWDENNAFVNAVANYVRVSRFGQKFSLDIFAITKAIERRRPEEALNILSQLLAQGDHPLQMMGGLLWSWKQSRGKIPRAAYHRGLEALQEADLNIKRSRLSPEQAMEVLVVKLTTK